MAKRLFLLHLGPDTVDVAAMTEELARAGVCVPATEAGTHERAAVEIRRSHKAAGLRRKHVEGAWASLCRSARRAKADCFVSMPDFFDAAPEQAALALDGLAGFRVVLVVTSGFTTEPPVAWTSLVAEGRPHVLPSLLSAEQLGAQVARIALIEQQAGRGRRPARIARRRRVPGRRLAA
ncbi:hypothetical protein GCM10011376_02690 [Nocardioides flavus (ex Wang et al. 2016)]|uniref:Uncharacterized protein n=1 Tax=Nocardioides flavus (ex Wang et al. 2016) TaxID=2058780 RepID=A0ABQ3HHX5_9ACTN|nr:hypothetical protein [Nocardioides flavus (ex Wang et al. 2016)]GHE15276.1 hypothetical protein GCM10011376_02690 [Nocardioides flavus (ex Wang et al. 2016)]